MYSFMIEETELFWDATLLLSITPGNQQASCESAVMKSAMDSDEAWMAHRIGQIGRRRCNCLEERRQPMPKLSMIKSMPKSMMSDANRGNHHTGDYQIHPASQNTHVPKQYEWIMEDEESLAIASEKRREAPLGHNQPLHASDDRFPGASPMMTAKSPSHSQTSKAISTEYESSLPKKDSSDDMPDLMVFCSTVINKENQDDDSSHAAKRPRTDRLGDEAVRPVPLLFSPELVFFQQNGRQSGPLTFKRTRHGDAAPMTWNMAPNFSHGDSAPVMIDHLSFQPSLFQLGSFQPTLFQPSSFQPASFQPSSFQFYSAPHPGSSVVASNLKQCSNCGSTSTPSWRRCPKGKQLLCNACGLYIKLHNRPRPFRVAEDGSIRVQRSNSLSSTSHTGQSLGPNSDAATKAVCENCRTDDTPLWRRADQGKMLCNACALYFKTHKVHRPFNAKNIPEGELHCSSEFDYPNSLSIEDDDPTVGSLLLSSLNSPCIESAYPPNDENFSPNSTAESEEQ